MKSNLHREGPLFWLQVAGVRHGDALQVANLARNFTHGAPIPDLKDGSWHMLSLTSQPDGSLGYRMYVDGALAGQMDGNQTYVGMLLPAYEQPPSIRGDMSGCPVNTEVKTNYLKHWLPTEHVSEHAVSTCLQP